LYGPAGSTLAALRFYPSRVESPTLQPTCSRHKPRDDNNQPARRQRIESADRQMATPLQLHRTKPLPPSPADTPYGSRSHGAAWVSYKPQATELPQLPRAIPPCSSQVLPSGAERTRQRLSCVTAAMRRDAPRWCARSASIRCSASVRPSQQVRFSHSPPGASTKPFHRRPSADATALAD